MQTVSYEYSLEALQELCNNAAGVLVNALYNDGLISITPEGVAKESAIHLQRKHVFGRLFEELFNSPEKGFRIHVVKLTLEVEEKEE